MVSQVLAPLYFYIIQQDHARQDKTTSILATPAADWGVRRCFMGCTCATLYCGQLIFYTECLPSAVVDPCWTN